MRRFFLLIITVLLGVYCLFPSTAIGGKQLSATSEQLQALYVQRLVKYVSWPESVRPDKNKPFIIAATDIKKLRPYFSQKNDATRFKLVQWPAEEAHVLVINGAPNREVAAILKRTADLPLLTIGQSQANLRSGVMINFYMSQGKLKLQINPTAAGQAGLFISSRLMKIARIYRGKSND
jgi:hypothetical protein